MTNLNMTSYIAKGKVIETENTLRIRFHKDYTFYYVKQTGHIWCNCTVYETDENVRLAHTLFEHYIQTKFTTI